MATQFHSLNEAKMALSIYAAGQPFLNPLQSKGL
jgi:hypothetical protein